MRIVTKNPVAKQLAGGKYGQRIVRDRTKYTRKTKHKDRNIGA